MFPKRRVKFTISIHSTARVETTLGATVLWKVMYFNPLHREGGDKKYPYYGSHAGYFNPLHREGGDRMNQYDVSGILNFNPLHREGGDDTVVSLSPCFAISIHSTARVETVAMEPADNSGGISIHSTARVETYNWLGQMPQMRISIHSTARVETLQGHSSISSRVFISIHSTARVETAPKE